MKMTIHRGTSSPLIAIGKNQCHLLAFAEKHQGWHSYAKNRETLRAIEGLKRRGCIEVDDEFKMFRLKPSATIEVCERMHDYWWDYSVQPAQKRGCYHAQTKGYLAFGVGRSIEEAIDSLLNTIQKNRDNFYFTVEYLGRRSR